MTVNSLAANLFTMDGGQKTLIGNISMFEPVEIGANREVIIELDAILQPLSIVNDIITAFTNGNFSEKIMIEGYANVDKYQIPIDETINVP